MRISDIGMITSKTHTMKGQPGTSRIFYAVGSHPQRTTFGLRFH
jgi:hypothetical protein